ncbi:hypothetical protein [Agrococcus sp. ARC_14]|uniref:hypothetical protein n=1 Tax=Agrococcus sp. ARC_14 TaxID=2919927 RepID=UPI001F05A481|nr:hypothetical protein [Agrococcus sp. ARC_14]MCH1884404.1 hypothetical protein [Agrococcus sp. ARC_14]
MSFWVYGAAAALILLVLLVQSAALVRRERTRETAQCTHRVSLIICWLAVGTAVVLPLIVHAPPTDGAEEDVVESAVFALVAAAALCFGITYSLHAMRTRRLRLARQ